MVITLERNEAKKKGKGEVHLCLIYIDKLYQSQNS